MNIEIRHVRAFLAVATELHFGRAANQLNIAQPALSRTVQNLEALLGVQLLERSTRSVQLTAAGQLFRDQFITLMRQMTEAVQVTQRVGRGDVGFVYVGYDDASLFGRMPDIIRRFRRANVAAKVELLQSAPEMVLQQLTERRIDFGFLLGPVKDNRLDTCCIHSEAPVVVLPVSHRLSLKSRITLQDLAQEGLIVWSRNSWEVLQRLCVKAGFVLNVQQEVDNLDALLAFVAAESGIGVCPANIQKINRSGVVTRPLVGTQLSFDLYCGWHKENASPLVAELAALASSDGSSRTPSPAKGVKKAG
jgi:DNA-binding transcriptional LysR family regulator